MSGKRNFIENKTWWAPVWKGLVMDEGAAHFQKMGSAIWLFLYFLLNANRIGGTLVRKTKTISSDMGIPRRTLFRWLDILRREGYVATRSSGRFLAVEISKWKPLGEVPGTAHQRCKNLHARSAENGTSQTPPDTPKSPWIKVNPETVNPPKKNTIKENILKRRFDSIDFKNPDLSAFKTREELLAYDLAQGLDDFSGFPLYLTCARQYPESLLRETLGLVREIPSQKIKTSRGALFNFLIHQHAKQSTNSAGH